MQAYQDMVFSTAARLLGNEAQAEDTAQDVFLKAYQNFAQLQASSAAGGWLKTVTTNLALNLLNRHRRRWRLFSELRVSENDAPAEFDVPVPDLLLAGIADAQQQRSLEQALQALPDHQRVPLVLYHFSEMPYADIAQQLNVSLSKVKVDILRGRQKLAIALSTLRGES